MKATIPDLTHDTGDAVTGTAECRLVGFKRPKGKAHRDVDLVLAFELEEGEELPTLSHSLARYRDLFLGAYAGAAPETATRRPNVDGELDIRPTSDGEPVGEIVSWPCKVRRVQVFAQKKKPRIEYLLRLEISPSDAPRFLECMGASVAFTFAAEQLSVVASEAA